MLLEATVCYYEIHPLHALAHQESDMLMLDCLGVDECEIANGTHTCLF